MHPHDSNGCWGVAHTSISSASLGVSASGTRGEAGAVVGAAGSCLTFRCFIFLAAAPREKTIEAGTERVSAKLFVAAAQRTWASRLSQIPSHRLHICFYQDRGISASVDMRMRTDRACTPVWRAARPAAPYVSMHCWRSALTLLNAADGPHLSQVLLLLGVHAARIAHERPLEPSPRLASVVRGSTVGTALLICLPAHQPLCIRCLALAGH